jgi:hypothetical protein
MSTATRTPPSLDPLGAAERLVSLVTRAVRGVAFWTAALLPLVLVAGLLAGPVGEQLDVVGGAIALNAVCALVGHGHSPS